MSPQTIAWNRLKSRPFTTVVVSILVGITLGSAGLLATGLSSLKRLDAALDEATYLTAYIRDDAAKASWPALVEAIARIPGVEEAMLRVPSEVAKEVRATLRDDPALTDTLDDEWLPAIIEIHPRGDIADLPQRIQAISGIDLVRGGELGTGPLRRLMTLNSVLANAGLLFLLGLMATAAALIAALTAFQGLGTREENDLMRLFGATERAVRMPNIVEGAFLGGLGALVGSALVLATVAALRGALDVPDPGIAGMPVTLPHWTTCVAFLFAGPLFGAVGAAIVTGRTTS